MDDLERELRSAAFHMSNILDLLRLPLKDRNGNHRVAQALMDMTASKLDPYQVLDLVDQEEHMREVEAMPRVRAPSHQH